MERFPSQNSTAVSWSGRKLREAFLQYTGLIFSDDQLRAMPSLKLPDTFFVLKQHPGVGWTSATHTSELVEFCAFSPGSPLFPPYLWNGEVHHLQLHAMEIA